MRSINDTDALIVLGVEREPKPIRFGSIRAYFKKNLGKIRALTTRKMLVDEWEYAKKALVVSFFCLLIFLFWFEFMKYVISDFIK